MLGDLEGLDRWSQVGRVSEFEEEGFAFDGSLSDILSQLGFLGMRKCPTALGMSARKGSRRGRVHRSVRRKSFSSLNVSQAVTGRRGRGAMRG